MADQRGHDVSKILADAFARFDGVIDGRIDAGRFGRVLEPLINSDVQLAQERERIVTPANVEWFDQAEGVLHPAGRRCTGIKHFPVVASGHFRRRAHPKILA